MCEANLVIMEQVFLKTLKLCTEISRTYRIYDNLKVSKGVIQKFGRCKRCTNCILNFNVSTKKTICITGCTILCIQTKHNTCKK